MVAYSFKRVFAPAVEARIKTQTIRGHRRRHARPGEPMQLYTGMRTRHCRKLIPDPVCSKIDEVRFDLRSLAGTGKAPNTNAGMGELLDDVTIEINGIPLTPVQRHDLARRDGFDRLWAFPSGEIAKPFVAMAWFWMMEHGPRLFEGVAIHWDGAS